MRSRTMRCVAAVAALASLAALSACGDDSTSKSKSPDTTAAKGAAAPDLTGVATVLELSGKEFAFDPATLNAPAGTKFGVKFTNKGVMEHDFTIEGHESEKVVGPIGGAVAVGTFTLAAGTYKYFCAVPGHKESGMTGTLTVA